MQLTSANLYGLAEMAMMKSYALASTQPDGKGAANRFVAYMVPKEVPQEPPAHPSNRYATLPHTCTIAV